MKVARKSIFWLECLLAFASALLAVVSAASPTWIEATVGLNPDDTSGFFEWAMVGGFSLSTVVIASVARREWPRALIERRETMSAKAFVR